MISGCKYGLTGTVMRRLPDWFRADRIQHVQPIPALTGVRRPIKDVRNRLVTHAEQSLGEFRRSRRFAIRA